MLLLKAEKYNKLGYGAKSEGKIALKWELSQLSPIKFGKIVARFEGKRSALRFSVFCKTKDWTSEGCIEGLAGLLESVTEVIASL